MFSLKKAGNSGECRNVDNHEGSMLREVSQTQKDKSRMTPFL